MRETRRPTRTIETDVCIVGAGIVGLVHALEARRRGLSVVVLERDARAAGASVRHAGHLSFSAAPAAESAALAETARLRWLDIARRSRLSVEDAGTLIVARHQEELAVLEAAADEPPRRGRMLSRQEVGSLVPIPVEGLLGGFHATHDLRVDPRAAPGALARLLARDPWVRLEWGANVHEVEPGVVHAGRLRVRAAAIIVCPGPGQRALPPVLRRGLEPLTLCQVQMLRLAAPRGRRYRPAIGTGLSLLQHHGFAALPGAEELRMRLELEHEELVERGVHPLVAQLPDGDLIIGEARTLGDPAVPFVAERLYRLLLDEVGALLGIEPEVRQRWQGLHSVSRAPQRSDLLVTAPLGGVRVVQSLSATGTALCPARACEVLDELLGEPGGHPPESLEGLVADAGSVAPLQDHARAFSGRVRDHSELNLLELR